MNPPELGAVVLGDIVERNFEDNDSPPSGGAHANPSQPVGALQRRPFPRYIPGVQYGLGSRAGPSNAPSAIGPSPEAHARVYSAHVQPEDPFDGVPAAHARERSFRDAAGRNPLAGDSGGGGEGATFLPVGGSAASMALPNVAHHWRPDEFRMLYHGYYQKPLPARVIEGLSLPELRASTDGLAGGVVAPTGEAFFNELFRCLRSTVRRHQYLALHALLLHLWYATDEEVGHSPAAISQPQPDVSLKERCVRGPDCGAFIFFVLEVLSTAAHPTTCQLAAACLLMLLRQEKDEFVEVMGEIGAPLSDPLEDAEGSEEPQEGHSASNDASKNAKTRQEGRGDASGGSADGFEMPFEEISELLRDDGDRKIGLEKMGYTNRIMMAMQILLIEPAPSASSTVRAGEDFGVALEEKAFDLEQLWIQLLLCGDISSPRVARRVAEDPAFATWTKLRLQQVVLGERPMANLTHDLLLWYRLMRAPAAGRALLRSSSSLGDYDPWGLFVILACTVKPSEGLSINTVKALALTFMIVREMVRHGLAGEVLRDVSEALLTDGLRVGAAMILEMWVLAAEQRPIPAGKERGRNRLYSGLNVDSGNLKMEETYFHEVALSAMELCRSSKTAPSSEQEDGARQALHYLEDATCRHYLATYFTTHPIDCLRLQGSVVETQQHMQGFLSHSVLRSDLLSESFLRLSLPFSREKQPPEAIRHIVVKCLRLHAHSLECLTGVAGEKVDDADDSMHIFPSRLPEFTRKQKTSLHLQLALKAVLTHANTRLIHAIVCGFPAINKDAIVGYVASLSAKYVSGCLGIRNHAQYHLLPDEVCTAVEVMLLLQEFTAVESTSKKDGEGEDRNIAGSTYSRDAQMTALFVLQSIAITKHCLDALPRAIVCLLGDRSALELEIETHGEPLVLLGRALQNGVETASNGGGGGTQGLSVAWAPRSWAIAPLYDDSFTHKALWASWLRRLLRLHQDVKNVLGWEVLLSHTLLWVLPRRQELFSNGSIPFNNGDGRNEGLVAVPGNAGNSSPDATASALVGLVIDLAGLLLSPAVRESGFSFAASETLGIALRAFTNPEAEDGLPWPLAVALALTATRCSPSTALVAARMLLVTPLIPHSGRPLTSADLQDIAQLQLLDGLLLWKTCRLECKTPRWSLEEMVSLAQLLGVLLAGSDGESKDAMTSEVFSVDSWSSLISDAEGFHAWCLCALADGFFHKFLNERRRGSNQGEGGKLLSFMERMVLRTTLEEVGWEPMVLWPHLQD